MLLPYGFGAIYLNKIMLGNISQAGLPAEGISVMKAMAIPALGMFSGLLAAVFISYRKPRIYEDKSINTEQDASFPKPTNYRCLAAAIHTAFIIQLIYPDSRLLSAMIGFSLFILLGVVKRESAESIFDRGIRMMALIGFVMIAAQGFAEVMKAAGRIQPLASGAAEMFAGSKSLAALIMLLIGLMVTMGIGSFFSTIPIIAAIYVPLCLQMGFSPLAAAAIIGTAGSLGDAGSPASDSTLGSTAGLNTDGQHDHIRDTVIPIFLHYNIPLLIAGWIAAMVL